MDATTRTARPANNLLRVLAPGDYALLAPHIVVDQCGSGHLFYNPGDSVDWVHFPCGPSMASFLVSNEDGRDVETVLLGCEGAVGGIVSHGLLPAYCRITVKYSGPFAHLRLADLQSAKEKSPALRRLFARYADCLLAQIFQSTACNAIHSIERRAAKWIIAAMDRTGSDRVPLTHEELATLLGVGRSYTSRVLQGFKTEGILETRRGALLVRNIGLLRSRSCRCNDAVRAHFDAVLAGVYPQPTTPPRHAPEPA